MVEKRDLANPDYEPSDEELVGLATRAFAEIPGAKRAMLQKLRADVAQAREEALRRLDRLGPQR